ncbi:hypothetical protein [Agathobaculum sp.]|uniref:hypothetical protein n=1 Tax=Agathobaculum sp. TaxID=2048138 RepID=UPI003AB8C206
MNPTLYNIANWLTLGTADTVKGAVTPEKSLSLEHWLDSLGVVSIAFGAYELAQKYAPAMMDDVAALKMQRLKTLRKSTCRKMLLLSVIPNILMKAVMLTTLNTH